MKRILVLMTALLLTSTLLTSCFKDKPDTSKQGLYIGVIGFNDDIHSQKLTLLNNNSKQEMKAFFAAVERSDFFRQHLSLIKKHSYAEAQKQTGITLLKTKLRNAALALLHIWKDTYFNEEMKLKEYLSVAYLILFEKLFIEGQPDFTAPSCALTLEEVLH